jgi:hypothetical protein
MKRRLWTLVLTILLVPMLSAAGQGARLKWPDVSQLAAKSSNTVDITLDPALISLAARFLGETEDDKELKVIISALKGIYVKSFEFDKDGAYSTADVEAIRQQLTAPGWSRLINVDSRREQSKVEIYAFTEGGKPAGFTILSAEPRELTIVNIIGAIDLEKLRALEGQFGVPKFDRDHDRERTKPRRDQ